MNEKGISNSMTVLGLANGMIGGTILILPILGLSAGYLTSWLMCLFIGTISCYTAYLIILHLGKSPNIKECILAHFGQDYRYVKAYSFCMWFSFVPYFIIYFRLICLQLEGIIEYYNEMIGFAAAFLLIAEVILIQKFRIGEKTLAYGVVSIVAFMIFLSWAQITRPSGEKSVPAIGDILPVVSGLEMAFSIHFLIA
jgi:amino acid permease